MIRKNDVQTNLMKEESKKMRKIIVLTGIIMVGFILVTGGIVQAKVMVVENGQDNVPTITEKKEVMPVTPIPKIGDKEAKGFTLSEPYATAVNAPNGVKIWRNEVEPNGLIPTHEGPASGEYICYMIAGSGELVLLDAAGKTVSVYHYRPGDVIVFKSSATKPNTLHYWKNSSDKTVIIGIQY